MSALHGLSGDLAGPIQKTIHDDLVGRRGRLASAIRCNDSHRLADLLNEVDDALARLDSGTYGVCDVCHDAIETDRLLADPLTCVCIDCLSPAERRALERDLELAARIQAGLLPEPGLAIEGWDVHTHYAPAGTVSGDYLDLLPLADASRGGMFLLGDVAGKGVSAALLMSNLHAVFRSMVGLGLPLAELVGRANHVFGGSTLDSSFATLVCGRAAPCGQVEIVNAGHNPPLLLHGSEVEPLPATGLPLGLFSSGPYASRTLHVAPGELLLLYTDGLSEAQNASGEELGVERLVHVLERHRSATPASLIEAVLAEVAAFQDGASRSDDLTLLALRRRS
jgi:sigma-B regulation protein RsbU (phosphoserine phosphatase)